MRCDFFYRRDLFSSETLFSGEIHFLGETRFSGVSFLGGNIFFGEEINILCSFILQFLNVPFLYSFWCYETIAQKSNEIPYNLSQCGNFLVTDFCLCVSLNNLYTLCPIIFQFGRGSSRLRCKIGSK